MKWYKVETKHEKAVGLTLREANGQHVLGMNEYPIDANLPKDVPYKYWIKNGNNWQEMNKPQKEAVDSALNEQAVELSKQSDAFRALALVMCDELGLTPAELEAKMKAKLSE